MNTIKSKDAGEILVANISLKHFSRGLYRSTAAVLKELVSNAYDADATEVRIDTNYPEFDFISCIDNGRGMPLDEFLRYFASEGIGTCIKRKNNRDMTESGRPIIGRLGVGMLAIGQLCNSFKIESHYINKNRKGEAYLAEIVLLDIGIPDEKEVVYEKVESNSSINQKTEIGKWEYKIIDYNEKKKGFRTYSSDTRATFRCEMKDSIDERMREKISFNQLELHSLFYAKPNSIRDCKPYLETIWELSILCPLPYYKEQDKYPILLSSFTSREIKSDEFKQTAQFLRERQSQLLKYDFHVVFDGIKLRRLFQLPTEKKDIVPKIYFIKFDDTVFGSKLKFYGYLFAQVSKAIRPLELNGVQIRLRGVGIGGYDSTFLKYYKKIETIRNRWVSGEIFVDEGLEEALNIDRDSFNEHEEHFKTLQTVLHNKLKDIFAEINRLAKDKQDSKREALNKQFKKNIEDIVRKQSKDKLKLCIEDSDVKVPTVIVDKGKGTIIWKDPLRKKKNNTVIGSIKVAFCTAKHISKSDKELEEIFYQLIGQILGKLV